MELCIQPLQEKRHPSATSSVPCGGCQPGEQRCGGDRVARPFLPCHLQRGPGPSRSAPQPLTPHATSLLVSNFLPLGSPPRPDVATGATHTQLYFLLFNNVRGPSSPVPPLPQWGLCDSRSLLIYFPRGCHTIIFFLGHRTFGTFGHLVAPLSCS